MALEKVLPTLENLDESLAPLYREVKEEGEETPKYHLIVDPDKLEKALVPNLRSALQKERQGRRDAETRYSKFRSHFGEDFDEEEGLKEILELADLGKRAKEGRTKPSKDEIDSIKEQLGKAHRAELEKVSKKTSKVEAQLKSVLIEGPAMAAIAASKGVPELLLPHVKAQTMVMEEDGEYVVRVVERDGTPRVNKNGDYMSIKELVEEFKASPVFGRAFDFEQSSGGGTPPGTRGSGGTPGAKKRSEMNVDEKSKFIEEQGLEKFMNLPY